MMFKSIGRAKVLYIGAMVYFNIFNFILLLINTNELLGFKLPIWGVIICGLLLVSIIGVFDYFFVLKHQLSFYNRQNDVKQQLNRVEDRLISLENKLSKGVGNGKQYKTKAKSN